MAWTLCALFSSPITAGFRPKSTPNLRSKSFQIISVSVKIHRFTLFSSTFTVCEVENHGTSPSFSSVHQRNSKWAILNSQLWNYQKVQDSFFRFHGSSIPELDEKIPRNLQEKFGGQNHWRKPVKSSRPAALLCWFLTYFHLTASVTMGNDMWKKKKT